MKLHLNYIDLVTSKLQGTFLLTRSWPLMIYKVLSHGQFFLVVVISINFNKKKKNFSLKGLNVLFCRQVFQMLQRE